MQLLLWQRNPHHCSSPSTSQSCSEKEKGQKVKETGVTFVDTKLHRTFACAYMYVQPFLFAFVELEENGGGHERAALSFF